MCDMNIYISCVTKKMLLKITITNIFFGSKVLNAVTELTIHFLHRVDRSVK